MSLQSVLRGTSYLRCSCKRRILTGWLFHTKESRAHPTEGDQSQAGKTSDEASILARAVAQHQGDVAFALLGNRPAATQLNPLAALGLSAAGGIGGLHLSAADLIARQQLQYQNHRHIQVAQVPTSLILEQQLPGHLVQGLVNRRSIEDRLLQNPAHLLQQQGMLSRSREAESVILASQLAGRGIDGTSALLHGGRIPAGITGSLLTGSVGMAALDRRAAPDLSRVTPTPQSTRSSDDNHDDTDVPGMHEGRRRR